MIALSGHARAVSRSLAVSALVAALLFALGALFDLHVLRLATKPWPVVALAIWVWRSASPGRYRTSLVLGLGASLAGDLFLEASPRGLFLPGLVSFLVAHLLYVAAYLSDTRSLAPLRALPTYAYGAALLALLWPGLGPMAIPVAVYAAVICTMLWRAAARIGSAPLASARLALGGAITFAASDSLIAVARFGGHLVDEALRTSTGWRLAIMTTYWLGQWAIAASAVARRPDDAPDPR